MCQQNFLNRDQPIAKHLHKTHKCERKAPTLHGHLSIDSAWNALNTSSKIQILTGQYCPNSYFTTSFWLGVPSTKLSRKITYALHCNTQWMMVQVQFHTFLTSTLDGCEWSAPHSAISPLDAHCIRGCMGPRAGLDAVGNRKPSIPD
jgi:hypothetical protein